MPKARELVHSFLMVLPLLVLYQAGLWITGFRMVNGVDFLSGTIYSVSGVRGLLLFNLLMAMGLAAGIFAMRKHSGLSVSRAIVPAMLESTVYALFLGSAISFVLRRAVPFGTYGDTFSPLQKITLSLGAGVYEELFFRFFLMGLFYYLAIDVLDLERRTAFLLALLSSALLFSYAHYVGPSDVAMDPVGFTYRLLAGIIFGLIYRYRSLAVAVYTHAIYDLVILFR